MGFSSFFYNAWTQIVSSLAAVAATMGLGWIRSVNRKAESADAKAEKALTALYGEELDEGDDGLVDDVREIKEMVRETNKMVYENGQEEN